MLAVSAQNCIRHRRSSTARPGTTARRNPGLSRTPVVAMSWPTICRSSRTHFRTFWKDLRAPPPRRAPGTYPHGPPLVVGDVVDQQRAVGVAVVDGAQRVEALLARRVPDRQRAGLAVHRQPLVEVARLRASFLAAVSSASLSRPRRASRGRARRIKHECAPGGRLQRRHLLRAKFVLHEAEQDRRLADAALAEEHDFEPQNRRHRLRARASRRRAWSEFRILAVLSPQPLWRL